MLPNTVCSDTVCDNIQNEYMKFNGFLFEIPLNYCNRRNKHAWITDPILSSDGEVSEVCILHSFVSNIIAWCFIKWCNSVISLIKSCSSVSKLAATS